jgi:hypothetical protein
VIESANADIAEATTVITRDSEFILGTRLSQDRNRKEARRLEGYRLFWCIKLRNKLVEEQIQQSLAERKKRLAPDTSQTITDNDKIRVFPISSNMYWETQNGLETPKGFPSQVYTGIPALRHWLCYATGPARERHLETVLNVFRGLFNSMNGWSTDKWKQPLELTEEYVRNVVLQQTLEKLKRVGRLFDNSSERH